MQGLNDDSKMVMVENRGGRENRFLFSSSCALLFILLLQF